MKRVGVVLFVVFVAGLLFGTGGVLGAFIDEDSRDPDVEAEEYLGSWKFPERFVFTRAVRAPAADPEGGSLWIGSEGGRSRPEFLHPVPMRDFPIQQAVGENLPSIQQVQQEAIRYAEVDPRKISTWRTRAGWSGWMPKVSLNFDRDKNRTIASATAGGKTTFSVGPEDQSARFGVDFSWQLGDLIWNPNQTVIDARSRLMVQLRQGILEEVTRLYFERKRLEAEFAAHPAEDPQLISERRLRIEEVEADIDALTGGYFSKMKKG